MQNTFCFPVRKIMYHRNIALEDIANNNEERSNHHSSYVDSGDLRIWEYLTSTFDYDMKFDQLPFTLDTRQSESTITLPKTTDRIEWTNLNDLQHHSSTSLRQPPPSGQYQTMQCYRQVNDVQQHDAFDNSCSSIFYDNFPENDWIDEHSSGLQSLPRPSIEPFSTEYNDQKIKAVSKAKSTPLLCPSLLVRNSPNWPLSIERATEPPSLSVLSERSHIYPIEPSGTQQTLTQTLEQTKASTPTTMPYVQRNGRVLSHLRFPSFSHLTPPHQEQMNKKLLLKPLSPYNYYYRDERDNIVTHLQQPEDPLPPPISDHTQEKLESLLFQRWFVDPTKNKRRHRRSHGCISFEELARKIADRWHQQPEHVYNFYYTVSSMDKIYYRKQVKLIQESEKSAT